MKFPLILMCILLAPLSEGHAVDCPPYEEDPWPFWGRTTTRLANTGTIGPQTPRVEWSIRFAFDSSESSIRSGCVMDSAGRIFCGHALGITAIDSIKREVLWDIDGFHTVSGAPSVWGDRVFWAYTTGGSFFCNDAATGEEIWSLPSLPNGYKNSAVVDGNGVVYFNDRDGTVYARNVSDGSEVWTTDLDGSVRCSPALLPGGLLVVGTNDNDLAALNDSTGEVEWVFPTGWMIDGVPVIDGQRVYVASWDRYLYAIDRTTGKELWRFWCEQINGGSIAIGHDGTIYTATNGNVGILFAVSPEGEELWRFVLPGLVWRSPIVGGDGTIYVCSSDFTGAHWDGRVHAIRPDGTEHWVKLLPDGIDASPMLAPDGTLYVACRDRFLYAFKDNDGDLNDDGLVNPTDLAALLGAWGPCPTLPTTCPADLNGDGAVGANDLAILLGNWGPLS